MFDTFTHISVSTSRRADLDSSLRRVKIALTKLFDRAEAGLRVSCIKQPPGGWLTG
jgi:hypothetical protein